nr:unnamed protein product [Callosobruchus analis]
MIPWLKYHFPFYMWHLF